MTKLSAIVLLAVVCLAYACKKDAPLEPAPVVYPYTDSVVGQYNYYYHEDWFNRITINDTLYLSGAFVTHYTPDSASVYIPIYTTSGPDISGKVTRDSTGNYTYKPFPYMYPKLTVTSDSISYEYYYVESLKDGVDYLIKETRVTFKGEIIKH